MKIVVLDGYTENPGDLSWAPLEALGETAVYDRTAYTESDLIAERIGDAEIAVVNKTPMSAATMDKCPNLKGIAVLATGFNIIDVEHAQKKGIFVMNVPAYGSDNVSQFTVSMLMELCSHIGEHSASVFAGEWASQPDFCYWKHPMVEVAGKTAGIIGLGRIGINTARILHAMKCSVLAFSPRESEEGKRYAAYVSLDELFSRSDFIFLHCPLTPKTDGIINAANISKMKHGVFIINTSRGPLIVEKDLYDALESGQVGGAALDVVSSEPIRPDNILLKAKNCLITPHIAWATRDARIRILNTTVENIRSLIDGHPQNVVGR